MIELPDDFPASPSWIISDACLEYMMKRQEYLDFLHNYHDLARRAIMAERDDKDRDEINARYLGFRQFFLETCISRMHDFFVQYMESIIFDILISDYENLVTEADRRRIKFLFDKNDTPEPLTVVEAVVERSASRQRLGDMCSFVRQKTGIDPLEDPEGKRFILIISALRNLTVHNDNVVNKRFVDRISGLEFVYEVLPGSRVKIDERWFVENVTLIDQAIFRFDYAVIGKFALNHHYRAGVFWTR